MSPLVGFIHGYFARHFSNTPAEARPDPNAGLREDTEFRKIALGFTPDWFLPLELAKKWQTPIFPLKPSRKSIADWRRRVEMLANKFGSFRWRDLPDFVEQAKGREEEADRVFFTEFRSRELSLYDALRHDLELLRQFDATLVEVSASKARPLKGQPGRRGYPIEALKYARSLRRKHRLWKAAQIRGECLKKLDADDMPPDPESFRRWMNRSRKHKRANRAN